MGPAKHKPHRPAQLDHIPPRQSGEAIHLPAIHPHLSEGLDEVTSAVAADASVPGREIGKDGHVGSPAGACLA